MKRTIQLTLIAALLLPAAALAARYRPEPAGNPDTRYKEERRETAEPREQADRREALDRREYRTKPVVRERAVVRPSFPIRREPPRVVVRRHPAPVNVRVIYSAPPIIWRAMPIYRAPYDRWGWEDTEVLRKWEGWTDVVLDVGERGHSLYLELSGPTQLDFAEVVFRDGHARVVDFRQRTHRRGLYELMDFRHDRRVEYVRLVARAMAPSVRISVRMV
jgi:hypothetical protein